MKKGLFLTLECPFPSAGGGKIRDAQIIQLLMERMELELVCFPSKSHQHFGMESIPEGLKLSIIERGTEAVWRRAVGPLRPELVNGWSDGVAQALRARAEPGKLLWVSRFAMAKYVPLARELGYRVILDEHRVASAELRQRATSSLTRLPGLIHAMQCSYYEGSFCHQADAVVAASEIDAARLRRLAPRAPVHVIPSSVQCSDYRELRQKPGENIFFSGTLSDPVNVEGLIWFVDKVLPRVRSALGRRIVHFVVAGADPAHELMRKLRGAGIEVHPNVPSILPLLSQAAVVFVPLRSGHGSKSKILQAMAAGRPVVSTGKGAEGLVLSPGFDVWIAESPDGFASALVRMLNDEKFRTEMAAHAVDTVERRYNAESIRPMLVDLLTRVEGAVSS